MAPCGSVAVIGDGVAVIVADANDTGDLSNYSGTFGLSEGGGAGFEDDDIDEFFSGSGASTTTSSNATQTGTCTFSGRDSGASCASMVSFAS